MEYWVSRTDEDLISMADSCKQRKIRLHSAIPIVATFQYSIIPPQACTAQPNITYLAMRTRISIVDFAMGAGNACRQPEWPEGLITISMAPLI